MRIGLTLSRHIAWRLTAAIVILFVIGLLLITILDFTQLARWITPGVFDVTDAALAALLRGPSLADLLIPFATLFGAIITFVSLNRRLELTVVRAAGMSAWQLLVPAVAVAVLVGIVMIALYSPGAAALREASVAKGVGESRSSLTTDGQIWLRQNGADGPSIIGAAQTAREGTVLRGVTAFVFNEDGTLRERVDAPTARLREGEWLIDEPLVSTEGRLPAQQERYRLPTNLTPAQIGETFADPETVPFWQLPDLIAIANASALPANHLRLRLHELLSLPLLLAAMVLIAAVVSLRFSRTLGVGRLIVAGAVSGFLLYLLLEVSRDLGRGGVVPPAVAAWAPAVLATLVSVTVLLHEEDG